eukprot:GHVN01050226.1.p1 GENE.GHVN01050226.1~~GHVN01050226.1.p1  ORF type:complete len:345 (+),score=19.53 GHVN01050226.1:57-1037(+)
MTISQLHRGFGVRVHTDDADPAVNIGAVTNYRVGDNVQVDREVTDGDIFASLTTLQSHDEQIDITSLNCDDVLDLVGTTGFCLKSDNTKTGFEFYLTTLDQCQPGSSAAADNIAYAAAASSGTVENYGLLYPGSFSIPHGGNASFSFSCKPKGNDGNAGLTVLEDVSLPAIVDTKRRFGMGPVTIGGYTLTGKQSVEVDFGISLLQESTDGSLFPEWVAIEKVLAMITIRGISPQWAKSANIPRGGKAFAHLDTNFYARLRDSTAISGYVDDATAAHIKGTANGKAYVTDLASGSGNASTTTSLVMYVEKDGSNAPIILNTLQAIT